MGEWGRQVVERRLRALHYGDGRIEEHCNLLHLLTLLEEGLPIYES